MRIQRVNRSDAEKVWINVRNMSGSTANGNSALCLDMGTTVDGISTVAPAAASFGGWVGIAHKDITDTEYGLSQIFGYRDSILLSHEGSSVTVNKGGLMHLVTGQGGLTTSTAQALSTNCFRYVIAATAQTVSAAAYTDGIIRCL